MNPYVHFRPSLSSQPTPPSTPYPLHLPPPSCRYVYVCISIYTYTVHVLYMWLFQRSIPPRAQLSGSPAGPSPEVDVHMCYKIYSVVEGEMTCVGRAAQLYVNINSITVIVTRNCKLLPVPYTTVHCSRHFLEWPEQTFKPSHSWITSLVPKVCSYFVSFKTFYVVATY